MTLRFLLRRSKAEGQEFSLDVQRDGCAAFARERGLLGATVEYVSDGVAGDDIEGLHALRCLLGEVSAGDVVICRDHSRLGRDMLESAATVRQIVADTGASLYYYATGEQVHWRGATDAAMTVLRGFAAQAELENIRSRTREAIRQRVKAGRVAGGRCYGYDQRRVVDNGKSYTVAVVNEEQAAVVRRIFADYIEGRGLKTIAIGLNDGGVPCPVVGKRGSGSWAPSQVRDILRRERYRGVYVHGQIDRLKKGGKRIARKAAPDSIIRLEIPEWRIVDDLTWQRAQGIMRKRAPTLHSDNRATHVLSGLARCADCGGPIGVVDYRVRQGIRVAVYGCQRHRTRGDSVCAMAVVRPAPAIEAALADAVRSACEHPDVVDIVLQAVRAEVEAQATASAQVDTAALTEELAEVRRQAKRLAKAIAMADEVPELVDELRARRKRADEIERALSVATRAPVEAAALVAQAEQSVRRQLAGLGAALASNAAAARDFYRGLFGSGGLTVAAHPTAKPARFVVRAGLDLVKRVVTPRRVVGGNYTCSRPLRVAPNMHSAGNTQ